MNNLPYRNIAGTMSHIDQWLEKILLTSYRHEALRGAQAHVNESVSIDENSISLQDSVIGDQQHGHKCFSQHFSALKELGLDRQSLELLGADKTAQERLYRSLFVYCNGVNEFISDYGRVNSVLPLKLWEAFFRLFQYFDPQCREMFLKYLFDTQNHNMQQTITELQEQNSKLQDENETLLQELMVTQVNLSSVKHEKQIQMECFESMKNHLQRKVQDCLDEYSTLLSNYELVKQAHKEALNTLVSVKDAVPQLILKLRRSMDETHRANTITENYKREYDVLLNSNKKLEAQIKDLNDELAKSKRVVIEKSFTIESLHDRDKELNEKMVHNQTRVDHMKRKLEETRSVEDNYFRIIDDLVRIVESSKRKLVSCCSIIRKYKKLFDTTASSNKIPAADQSTDFFDDAVVEFLLKESALPSRFQLANVDQDLKGIDEGTEGYHGGNNSMAESVLLPIVNTESNLQSKMNFIDLLRQKIDLHFPFKDFGSHQEEFPGGVVVEDRTDRIGTLRKEALFNDCGKSDMINVEATVDFEDSATQQHSDSVDMTLLAPPIPMQCDFNHQHVSNKSVNKVVDYLIYGAIPTTVVHDLPLRIIHLSDSLRDVLPRFQEISAKYEILFNKYQALVYMHENIDSPLITRYFGQIGEERNQKAVLESKLSEEQHHTSVLQRIISDLKITQEKYQVLEPKFLKLVEHYKERMIAKKKVEDDLEEAKTEIESLLQYKKRLRVCEERIEVLVKDLEEKTRIIVELQEERKEWLIG